MRAVPLEPTPEMIEAICAANAGAAWPDGYGPNAQMLRRNSAREAYKNALAAAPSPVDGLVERLLAASEGRESRIAHIYKLCREAAAALQSRDEGWQPIETAPFENVPDNGKWLDWCLLGRFDAHGWVEWVGGMDADMWLSRDATRACGDCQIPSYWMPLREAPTPPRKP